MLEVPAEVAPGDEVPLSVDNVTEDATLTFGLSGRVERASGERWVEAADAAVPRPVPEIAVVVEPGESSRTGGGATADVIELTTDAEPGAYRVLKDVTATERGSGGANRATLCAGFAVSD